MSYRLEWVRVPHCSWFPNPVPNPNPSKTKHLLGCHPFPVSGKASLCNIDSWLPFFKLDVQGATDHGRAAPDAIGQASSEKSKNLRGFSGDNGWLVKPKGRSFCGLVDDWWMIDLIDLIDLVDLIGPVCCGHLIIIPAVVWQVRPLILRYRFGKPLVIQYLPSRPLCPILSWPEVNIFVHTKTVLTANTFAYIHILTYCMHTIQSKCKTLVGHLWFTKKFTRRCSVHKGPCWDSEWIERFLPQSCSETCLKKVSKKLIPIILNSTSPYFIIFPSLRFAHLKKSFCQIRGTDFTTKLLCTVALMTAWDPERSTPICGRLGAYLQGWHVDGMVVQQEWCMTCCVGGYWPKPQLGWLWWFGYGSPLYMYFYI